MKKDAYYFPHFCNARHDRKIMRLRKELGVEGYGIFFMLLEVLREQIDFKYPMQDIDLLAEEFGCSEQKIKVVICNYQLFQLDESEQFFSPKLMLYLEPYLNMKEQRRLAGIRSGEIRRLKSAENEQPLNNRSASVEQPLNENEQSKRKKSKVKESKVNKNKYAEFVSMTEEEYNKLIEKYGQINVDRMITILDNYKGANNKKYTSDYRAILNWVVDKVLVNTNITENKTTGVWEKKWG